jgi:hypothetical protein
MHDNAYFNGCTSNIIRANGGLGAGRVVVVAPETAVYAAMKHAREPEPRNLNAAAASERARAGGLRGSEPRSRCFGHVFRARRESGSDPSSDDGQEKQGDGDYEAPRADPDEAAARHSSS